MSDPYVISLDAGTSSVRTLLFDGQARVVEGYGTQIPYRVTTTADGGVEVDADHLADLAAEALTAIHQQLEETRIRPSAVAFCTFWHNVLGVGADSKPATPIIHLFDTRAASAARRLAGLIDARAQHARTGCVLHPSYLPAKLLWLSETQPAAFRASVRWMSFGEYFFLKLFGKAVGSASMVSGTGLWNQRQNRYDEGILAVLPIRPEQLTPLEDLDCSMTALLPEYAGRWPRFAETVWYPALGDGACNNIGSGCHTADRFALMVGTSGAMRAVCETADMEIPEGLWCYRVDRNRYVLGGALSNGGEVYAWMKRTLVLPDDNEIEARIAAMTPGEHGLTILPLFAGERSTKWRAEARAAFAGMSLHTSPMEMMRAALESVALRFREIYEIMEARLGAPAEVVASGGALLRSPAWTQMMADALGRPVVSCLEKESTARGAALLALERLGAIRHIRDLPAETGAQFRPAPGHLEIYREQLRRQRRLYAKLFEEN